MEKPKKKSRDYAPQKRSSSRRNPTNEEISRDYSRRMEDASKPATPRERAKQSSSLGYVVPKEKAARARSGQGRSGGRR